MVLCFCYESPLFLNTLSCEVKKRNEYVVLGGSGGGGGDGVESCSKTNKRHCFDLMSHVSHPLYAFPVHLKCGTRPF